LTLMCYVFPTLQTVLLIHIKTCGHTKIIIELMKMKGAWHMQPVIVGWHAYLAKAVGVLLKIRTI
jgi:hypothetical protein